MIIHVSIYMWVCLIQAILALAIAQGGVAALDAMTATKKGWSSDKILSVGAGGLLFAYGLWLLREWWLDDDDDDDGEGGDNGGEGESESLVGSGDDKEKREYILKRLEGLQSGQNTLNRKIDTNERRRQYDERRRDK